MLAQNLPLLLAQKIQNLFWIFIRFVVRPNLWFLSRQSNLSIKIRPKGLLFMLGWTGRIRTCECWDQNPVPYRLATVQSSTILSQRAKNVKNPYPLCFPLICATIKPWLKRSEKQQNDEPKKKLLSSTNYQVVSGVKLSLS